MRTLLVFLCCATVLPADDLPTTLANATGWVRCGDRTSGTGWLVDRERRWLITARHVLADRETCEVFFPVFVDGQRMQQRDYYLSRQKELSTAGLLVKGKVVAQRAGDDLVLVELESVPKSATILKLSSHSPQSGEECSLVGHRHDAETLWTFATGVIRQTGTLSEGYFWATKKLGVGSRVAIAQIPAEAGESGAAIANAKGEVVGLLSAVSQRTPGVSIGIEVSALRSLLADARGEKTPKPPEGNEPTVAETLMRSVCWVRPQATDGRWAGVLFDTERRLLLTSASAVGNQEWLEVVFPQFRDKRLVAESEAYRDLLALRLEKRVVRGLVLVKDAERDLAIVRLEHVPVGLTACKLASREAKVGERVLAVNHPVGLELVWLFSSGTLRSVGQVRLNLTAKEDAPKPQAMLLQLPQHGNSAGGPLANERGELLSILSAREGARQEVGYAATLAELREFLKSAAPRSQPTKASEHRDLALFLQQRGAPETALEHWQQAVRLAPLEANYRLGLALAFLSLGAHKEAKVALAPLEPEKLPVLLKAQFAEATRQLGDNKLALALVEACVRVDPKCARALLTRAQISHNEADLREALFLESDWAEVYRVRTQFHPVADPERFAKTLTDLSRALELEPYDVATLQQRAKVSTELREYKRAYNDWVRLTELQPLNATWQLELAQARLRAGEETNAAQALLVTLRLEATMLPKVYATIEQRAGELVAEQAVDWCELALSTLRPWLPRAQQMSLDRATKEANQEIDSRKKVQRYRQLLLAK